MVNGKFKAILLVEAEMDRCEVFDLARGQAACFSTRSPDKESANEDSAALIPFNSKSAVLVVADGLGGQPLGSTASRIAVEKLRDSLARAEKNKEGLRAGVLDGFEQANKAIMELGVGAATTLAAVAIEDNVVRPYHVGDSIILVFGQRGKMKLQTIPHSPVGYAVEAGIIDEKEAMRHADRHIVSNVLGTEDMRITIGPEVELSSRDTVLVASDGLCDNLHLEEIVERLRSGQLEEVSSEIAVECRKRMISPNGSGPSKPDDLSLIAFRLSP